MNLETRREIAAAIAARLNTADRELAAAWQSGRPTRHFILDDLLPAEFTGELSAGIPSLELLMLRSSLRERKRVGGDLKAYGREIGECLWAFQDPEVIRTVARITGIDRLEGDPSFYAAGLSVMGRGDFLNPHLDNSHDGDGRLYRVLNLLFYVSPAWAAGLGGSLELWDADVQERTEIPALFNRLVVMETCPTSWHSVNRLRDERPRICCSNYYFSPDPPGGRPYLHVTTFTGRPEEPLRRLVLGVDAFLRNARRRHMPWLRGRPRHRIYEA